MQLIVEAGADLRRENLPTADDIALLIPDEYGEASFRDIVLAERNGSGFRDIHPLHPVYMTAAYPLMFPTGRTTFRWGLRQHDAYRDRSVTLRDYARYFVFANEGCNTA